MTLREPGEFEDDYVILSDIEPETALNPDVSPINTKGKLQRNNSSHSSKYKGKAPISNSGSSNTGSNDEADEDEDSEPEEIEYGYDNDTLLIMPAMLKDYSHHATNYHPELWKAPIPGTTSLSQAALERCRHEGKMQDNLVQNNRELPI